MPAAGEYLLLCDVRVKQDEVHSVLKLIAEAERAAALINGASSEDAACQRLIHSPAAHISVRLAAAGNGQTAAHTPPMCLCFFERFKCGIGLAQIKELFCAFASADEHGHGLRLVACGKNGIAQPVRTRVKFVVQPG